MQPAQKISSLLLFKGLTQFGLLLCAAIIIATTTRASAQAAIESQRFVSGDGVALRNSPDIAGKLMGRLARGEEVRQIGTEEINEFCRVKPKNWASQDIDKDTPVYMFCRYLSATPVVITAPDVSGISPAAEVVGKDINAASASSQTPAQILHNTGYIGSPMYFLLGLGSCALLAYALSSAWRNHRSLRDASESKGYAVTEFAKVTADASSTSNETKPSKITRPLPFDISQYVRLYDPQESELHIYTKIALFGPTTANITVHKDGSLVLLQICVGDVSVRAGGELFVLATVAGNLTNNGGIVHLYGNVLGQLHTNSGDWYDHNATKNSVLKP